MYEEKIVSVVLFFLKST